jgi:hypothetical protein
MVKEFYAYAEQEGILLGVSVVPDDPSVDSEFFSLVGDSDFQEALFRCCRHGMKDMKSVGVNGVREQGDALMREIVQLAGQQGG